MGKLSNWHIEAWMGNGKPIGASRKEEVQDWVFDAGASAYGASHDANTPFVMDCFSESYHAFDIITESIASYARINPDVLIEVVYECEDDNDYRIMRFFGNDFETQVRLTHYPPFTKIKLRHEQEV